jgi:hypothetical protein
LQCFSSFKQFYLASTLSHSLSTNLLAFLLTAHVFFLQDCSDFSLVRVRPDILSAIERGYMSEMHTELTTHEKAHFLAAGAFMIYMQAVRFLTDAVSGDVYYPIEYPGHNAVRAENQLHLLRSLQEHIRTADTCS